MTDILKARSQDDNYKVQILELKTKEVLQYVYEGMAEIGVLLRNKNN